MQRGARLSFAPSTVRECTFVHDQTGTGARLEIARDAPPQFEQLSQKMDTTKPAQAQGSRLPAMRHRSLNNFHKKWDNNNIFDTG